MGRLQIRVLSGKYQALVVSAFSFSAVLTRSADQTFVVSAFSFSAVLTRSAGQAFVVSAFSFSAV
jgi:hypothetical protein